MLKKIGIFAIITALFAVAFVDIAQAAHLFNVPKEVPWKEWSYDSRNMDFYICVEIAKHELKRYEVIWQDIDAQKRVLQNTPCDVRSISISRSDRYPRYPAIGNSVGKLLDIFKDKVDEDAIILSIALIDTSGVYYFWYILKEDMR